MYKLQMGGSEDGARLLLVLSTNRKRDNEHKLKYGKINLNQRNNSDCKGDNTGPVSPEHLWSVQSWRCSRRDWTYSEQPALVCSEQGIF